MMRKMKVTQGLKERKWYDVEMLLTSTPLLTKWNQLCSNGQRSSPDILTFEYSSIRMRCTEVMLIQIQGFDMVRESWSTIRDEFTKGNLKMMFDKDTVTKNTITITFTLGISQKGKLMVKDSTHGQMVSTTKGSGTWAKNTDSENGRVKEAKLTSETGE